MVNDEVMEAGSVENVNVDPPFTALRTVVLEDEVTTKSEESPSVGPRASETVIVHAIKVPVRAGLVFVHDKVDAVVG